MKKPLIILTIFLGVLQFSLSSNSKNAHKTPPGTSYVKPLNYYVDKSAITMSDWQEFYVYTKQTKGADEALKCLPNIDIIQAHYGKDAYNSDISDDKKLSIVGITLTQIKMYAEFRTEAVRQLKGFENVTYYPLDDITYSQLEDMVKIKNVNQLSSNIPEVIFYEDGEKVLTDDGLINYEESADAFGFRCIAKYSE